MKLLPPLLLLLAVSIVIPIPGAEKESEKPSVEDAARRFRILTYGQFRTDRAQYDARRQAGDQLLETWEAARRPRDHRETVVNWFLEAIALTEQDPAAALPPLPELPKVSSTSTPVSRPELKPAYLDPEAVRSLSEIGDMFDPQGSQPPAPDGDRSPEASDGANSAASTLLKGLKRIVLGNE